MNGFLEFLQKLGPARLAAMGAVSAILVGFFALVIMRLSEPQMMPLYTELGFDDSAAIIKQLESMDVRHEIRNDGATILVARDEALRVRMRLAEAGLPTGGSVGYELFDKTSSFGTTSFVQNINRIRALEGELARTIRTIDRVASARVHLVLPERELFRRERAEPTASIALKVRGTLEMAQIRGIQHLVAAAIEGLKPGRVSIIDETGRLLASGNEGDDLGVVAAEITERRTAIERRIRNHVEDIVGQVVGPGRTRVQVAAELDFNRLTQTDDLFDPESQVVRSTQSRTENATTKQPKGDGSVSVGNQLPGADGGSQDEVSEASSTEEETINYEISRTTKTLITEAGRIKRLSVAVLVDGIYSKNEKGDIVYSPRPQEQIDRIAALVRSAVGFDQERGDQVEVVNLQFAQGPPSEFGTAASDSFIELTKEDYLYFAELGVITLLTLLVLFFVVRPLLKRILAPEEGPESGAAGETGMAGELTSETGNAALPAPAAGEGTDGEPESLAAAQAVGSLQANSISRVGALIESNPNEAVAIVRAWLNEAA